MIPCRDHFVEVFRCLYAGLFISTLARADDPTSITEKVLQELDSMVGKGILNGKFHIFTGSTANADQTTWSHLVTMGIDPTTQKAASWEFSCLGARSDITYDTSGVTIYGVSTQANGDRYSFEGRFVA